MNLETKFDHSKTEKDKYKKWLENKVFESNKKSNKPSFSIILPPPNVTGKLHLGHAWDGTLQDILIRYKKMQGYEAIWFVGMDHAGIATQAKVLDRLREQGINKENITREEFLDKAWQWKDEYASVIKTQWGKMGFALDYSVEKFTLDEDVNKKVNEVFVDLYEKGLIYKGNRITNWDPVAKTAISDIEVIYKEVTGGFYHLKYVAEDGSNFLEVATTRPETCFGDVALALNPNDKRANKLKGKKYYIPGTDILIPIILDEHVDMDFGSGVVKITPAHDQNDYEVGIRHDLEQVIIMNLDATMNEKCFEYSGLDRFECRSRLITDLMEKNLVIKIVEHIHNVGHSERSGAIIEPLLSQQWYVKMQELAKKSIEFQKTDKKVNFFPNRFESTFLTWMHNIQDWCISRQLWWGHQIPVWYHKDTKEIYVSTEQPRDAENYIRDEDVLDTWFSSALWPLVNTIWNENKDLHKFFETSVLVTGYDIIFFWVSRMIFQSLEFEDTKPFSDVLIHGLIRAEDGKKMSKSLGNGIDPMDVINSHGADALRFFLTTNSAPGQDLRYMQEKLDSSWNFINKIWNISRYVLLNTEDIRDTNVLKYQEYYDDADKYILNELNDVISYIDEMMDRYEFSLVAHKLYNYIWEDFANWYIESSKVSLASSNQDIVRKTKTILKYVNMTILKLIHPFMPFVTDEIYNQFEQCDSLMTIKWPVKVNYISSMENNFTIITKIIVAIRNLKQENEIKPSELLDVYFEKNPLICESSIQMMKSLAKLNKIEINHNIDQDYVSIVIDKMIINVVTEGKINNHQKIIRLQAQAKKLESEIQRCIKMLSNDKFISKAPESKINEEKEKGCKYVCEFEEVLELLSSMEVDFIHNIDISKLRGWNK